MHGTTTKRGALLAVLVATTVLAGCTSGSGDSGRSSAPAPGSTGPSTAASTAGSSSAQAAPAAVITAAVSSESAISPADPVRVSIANGELTSVSLLNPAGKVVKGTLAAGSKSWQTAEDLGYGKTYKLTATGKNADGVAVTKKQTIATVKPDNFTMPSITDLYGSVVGNGATYGVGMIVRVHFDEQVDKARAEKTLSVTTTPKVTGGWYWNDSQNAYWRPQAYYPTGTKVTIKADAYGKKLGSGGLYGQDDKSASFTIGQKRVSIASPKSHKVKVYFDNRLVRTMPTSMGKGGYEPGSGNSINFWTMHGTYTVLGHENPATMSSASFGVKKGSPNYYPPEKIYYSTKISTDGIYLHELNTTIWAQGHQNVSHGCLNLRTSNAKWFYNNSRVGDIVQVTKGLGNPEITFDQGGQWSVPWSKWVAGSALT